MIVEPERIIDFQVHPLGFYYLVLSSGEVTTRLHVYTDTVDFSRDNEWHTHEFDLNSEVVVGALQNSIGRFIAGQGKPVQEFVVRYEADRSTLEATGNWGEISELVEFTTSAGKTYSIKAGTIHRVMSVETPCVTHVRMRHHGGDILSYGTAETPFERRQVNADEVCKIYEILTINNLVHSS